MSAVTVFLKQRSIFLIFGLSNEILCILVAQGAAKVGEVKLAG